MRTTEAARYARWSVLIAAMLVVTVAGVYGSRAWQARQAQKAAPPPVPPAVQQRSQEFSFSKVDGNHTQFIVRASRATEFKEGGRSLLEEVWITAFGRSGQRSDHLRTRACEYFAQDGAILCPEEVRMDLRSTGLTDPSSTESAAADPASGGVQIVTSKLSFNRQTGVATSAEPVQFRFAQGQGRAVGLRYDSQRGELHLLHDVEMVLRSQPHGDPMMVSSRALAYRREERLLQLNGAARIRQGRQELQAGQITFELDAEMTAQRMVARDHPQLRDPDDHAEVSLSADELAAPLGLGGRPERLIATGHVVFNALTADGRNRLTAAWSDLELAPETQQPRHLKATGDVLVQSSLPDGSTRRLQTPALEVRFASAAPEESRIESATAIPATLEWQNYAADSSSRQQVESMRLTGRHLDGVFGESGQLRELQGTGGVEVHRRMGSGPLMTSTSRDLLAHMGPDGSWSSVEQSGAVRLKNATGDAQADHARFERAADSVALAGSVLLSDATSRTRARSATFRQGASELRAEGDVATSEVSPSAAEAGGVPPEPAHVSSDRLVADTASGHAVYSGNARLWQGDSMIQAATIDLDRAKRTLVATGDVRAVFPQVRPSPPIPAGPGSGSVQRPFWRVQAGRMTYEQGEHHAKLEQDAWVRSEESSMRADQMDLFFVPGAASGGRASASGHPPPPTGLGRAFVGQELERAAGFGAVRVESGERTGTGERADYVAAEEKFVLSGGSPALRDRDGNSATGRQLTFFLADDRIVIDSEEGSRTLTLHRVEK